MKPSFFLAPFLAIATLQADTILLKSGEKIEGRVTATTEESVTIDVPFSETIVEQRIIPRAEIVQLEKESGDIAAFAKLQTVTLPETAFSPEPIAVIALQYSAFVQSFPDSSHTAAVKELLTAAEAEQKRLEDGEIKLFGSWLTSADQADQAQQIEAAKLLIKLQEEITAGQWGTALNTFDILEKRFRGTFAYVRAIPLARDAIGKLEQQLTFTISSLPTTLEQRKRSLDLAPLDSRDQVAAALARDDARATDLAATAQARGEKFFPILPYDEKGLKAMQLSVRNLAKQLETIELAQLETGVELAKTAARQIEEKNITAAESTLTTLTTTWPGCEAAVRLNRRLTEAKTAIRDEELQAERDRAAEAEAAKKAEAADTAKPPGESSGSAAH